MLEEVDLFDMCVCLCVYASLAQISDEVRSCLRKSTCLTCVCVCERECFCGAYLDAVRSYLKRVDMFDVCVCVSVWVCVFNIYKYMCIYMCVCM